MNNLFALVIGCGSLCIALFLTSCKKDDDDDTSSSTNYSELPAAFARFDEDNVTVMLDGDEIVIESNGVPNHKTPYWPTSNPLYEASSDPDFAATPSKITTETTTTLRVPLNPSKASSSSSTNLGPIGISISGAVIYNDQEGPNTPIDDAAVSLDWTGAHIGPATYHYHTETKAWSEDDNALIGVMADGFLLYGRRCVGDTHPDDLDDSGGHTSASVDDSEANYHYHIKNQLYLNKYYLLFDGDYQGTSNQVVQ